MYTKGVLSKSGATIYDSYKENIVIDKYNRVFQKMRNSKLEAIRSENSEDAMTWNTFRTLQKIDPDIWLPSLFLQTFGENRSDLVDDMKISLWKKLNPPTGMPVPEGDTEVDVMLENAHYVWCIEVKFKSDISMRTTHDETRNQVLRTIDVGSHYAGEKDFYFSLLILDEKFSPKGKKVTEYYQNNLDELNLLLPHREDPLKNVKGISLLHWMDFRNIFADCEENALYEDERLLAGLAKRALEKRFPAN